jgi:hypothetical protein
MQDLQFVSTVLRCLLLVVVASLQTSCGNRWKCSCTSPPDQEVKYSIDARFEELAVEKAKYQCERELPGAALCGTGIAGESADDQTTDQPECWNVTTCKCTCKRRLF